MQILITLKFDKYIADPYWPAQEKVINIGKQSGVNRCRTQEKRDQVLRGHLTKIGMSMEEYRALEAEAARPFYLGDDGAIVIPEHQIYGCLVQTARQATGSVRVCAPEQVRTLLRISNWLTPRRQPDGVFERFVRPMDAKGALSNQRSLRSDPFIKDFSATGTLSFDPSVVNEKRLREYVAYAGRETGVGACRKMGYGRFTVADFQERA